MFWPLVDGSVDIYYTYIRDISGAETKELENMLNDKESETYSLLKNTKRKAQFLFSRGLLKRALAYYFHTPLGNIPILRNEYGKPYLERKYGQINGRNIEFNLSHAGDIVACAFTLGYEIGTDVELRNRYVYDVAELFFNASEVAYMRSCPEELRNDTACRLWTLKEAYLKLIGTGLSMPMDSFSVIENREVFFHTVEPGEAYYLSVAVNNKNNIHLTTRVKEIRVDCLIDPFLNA